MNSRNALVNNNTELDAGPIPLVPLLPGQSLSPVSSARVWPTLPELVNALKRRLVLAVFLGVLVGMAGGAAIWLAMPNGRHRASALLQVRQVAQLARQANQNPQLEFDSFKKNQETIIRSRNLMRRVIANPNIAKLPAIRTDDDPVRWLQENLQVIWRSDELMEVAMRGDDQKQLKEILNAIVNEFVKDSNSETMRERNSLRKIYEEALNTTEDLILGYENRIKKGAELGGTTPEFIAIQLDLEAKELTRLRGEQAAKKSTIEQLKIEVGILERKLNTLKQREITLDEIEKFAEADPEMKVLSEQKRKQTESYEKDAKVFGTSSQTTQAQKAKIDEIDRKISDRLTVLRPRFENDIREKLTRDVLLEIDNKKTIIETYESLAQSFEQAITASEAKLKGLRVDGNQTINDVEDLKPLKERRNDLQRELLKLNTNDKVDSRISIREDADVVLNQNFSQKVLLSVVSFLAGCLAVMTAIAYLEWRSRRVDSVDQVVNDLGLRVIGTIPAFPSKQALKSGDAAQSQNWRFVLNESVNSARTMLLHTAKTQNMQVLMVTSAMQGEGKTSLASQLATSMATAGLRTLILDCDLRNPSMHKLFDAPLTPGCAEVLCQEIDVSDAVQPTTVPNLWLIAAGQCSNRVITALAQGHPLEALFNRLRGQFDFIVVDSCPVLPVADSLLVGQYVDGVVLSILQDISQLPKVMTTAEKLTLLNIPLLGAVVNGIKPDIHAYGYNYVKQLPV